MSIFTKAASSAGPDADVLERIAAALERIATVIEQQLDPSHKGETWTMPFSSPASGADGTVVAGPSVELAIQPGVVGAFERLATSIAGLTERMDRMQSATAEALARQRDAQARREQAAKERAEAGR